ncbi:hypothetical protein [Sphingomonas glacialis]|uniref:AbrB/MazE/SpoVT family DNA-binding domain-containing protein n=1 Tax=Sphingomonas glacialis TaxID=658225 RepID=A0A502FC42_9SPHN|nr:hypothetical protein [Sphingomonas glacialis]TPG46976.1 hypothetical protein EAH76_22700 [Sphingomonas glacialis]
MDKVETRVFETGDGIAVHLPDDFASVASVLVSADRKGDRVTITAVKQRNPLDEKRKLAALMARLDEVGPVSPVETRASIEFPDRPGL